MKLANIAAGLLLVAALPTLAQSETKAVGSGPNPFSDCGIGAALFPEHKVLAVTSNVIWDVGTTAVTSATASPETCNGKQVTAAHFILDSYENLAEETARGQGEHLVALMNILELDSDSRAAVIEGVRAQMSTIVSSDEYVGASLQKKSSDYYNAVMAALPAA